MLGSALAAGLCSIGADVIQLGVVPTPAVAYLVQKYGADAGVMISASHNPAEFNGIKIFRGNGFKLPDMLEERIEAGLGEEGFREFEVSYSESRVTENYPDGIYINKRVDYTSVFSAELLSAMGSLDGVGKITSARDKNDSGTYYVIRCALPEESYRSEDSKVIHSLSGFTEYAAAALYREELLDCLTDAEWVTEKQSAYTVAKTVKAQDYNVVRALGF